MEAGADCLADGGKTRGQNGAGAGPAGRRVSAKGKNFVVSPLTSPSYERVQDGLKISFVSPIELRLAVA